MSESSVNTKGWTYPLKFTLWVYTLSLRRRMVLFSFGTKRQHSWSNSAHHSRWVNIYRFLKKSLGIVYWQRKSFFKGKVCGLCGNYDGNRNDFLTSNREIVVDAFEFGNSWKVSSTCPDVNATQHPCSLYSNRQAWASKHCSIIKSDVFSACHSSVRKSKHSNFLSLVSFSCRINHSKIYFA